MAEQLIFGDLLRAFRYRANLTQVDLAVNIGYSFAAISQWERNRAIPPKDTVKQLAKALSLNSQETSLLFKKAGYGDEIVSAESTPVRAIGVVNDEQIVKQSVQQNESPIDIQGQLQIQIQDIKTAMEELGKRVDNKTIENSDDQTGALTEEVQDIRDALSELQHTSQEVTAPVALPTREQMEVKLIPSTSFERLEEYRSEENKWASWAGVFVGAMLGVFVNLATGGQASTATIVILGTFAVMFVITAWTAVTYNKRAKSLMSQIMGKGKNGSA